MNGGTFYQNPRTRGKATMKDLLNLLKKKEEEEEKERKKNKRRRRHLGTFLRCEKKTLLEMKIWPVKRRGKRRKCNKLYVPFKRCPNQKNTILLSVGVQKFMPSGS